MNDAHPRPAHATRLPRCARRRRQRLAFYRAPFGVGPVKHYRDTTTMHSRLEPAGCTA